MDSADVDSGKSGRRRQRRSRVDAASEDGTEVPVEDDVQRKRSARERGRWELHRRRAHELVCECRRVRRYCELRPHLPLPSQESNHRRRQRSVEQRRKRTTCFRLEDDTSRSRGRIQLRQVQEDVAERQRQRRYRRCLHEHRRARHHPRHQSLSRGESGRRDPR